jgi:hypothetical protein
MSESEHSSLTDFLPLCRICFEFKFWRPPSAHAQLQQLINSLALLCSAMQKRVGGQRMLERWTAPAHKKNKSLYYIGWFLCVIYLFNQEELKRAASLGVFGVADPESDIRFSTRLGVRTRKVEKSIKFLLSLKRAIMGFSGSLITNPTSVFRPG